MIFPPPRNFKWIRKVLMQAPARSKKLQKPAHTAKSASQKYQRKQAQLVKTTPKRGGKHKAKQNTSKKAYLDWEQDSP
eukprot:10097414-Ditylum_brightwellii.AAC.2